MKTSHIVLITSAPLLHAAPAAPPARSEKPAPAATDGAYWDKNQMYRHHLHQPWLHHTDGYRDIIRRFDRFPHRNRIPGRLSTSEEVACLRDGGFTG
ncbi:DUF924 family protein [Chromobacterium vaccinii]|nr:DUF924 family protein [Chromobacterium vaccinii]